MTDATYEGHVDLISQFSDHSSSRTKGTNVGAFRFSDSNSSSSKPRHKDPTPLNSLKCTEGLRFVAFTFRPVAIK